MAILGNLRAFIVVNGNRRKEYVDEDREMENENPDLVSKYIESKSGVTFTIQVEFKKSFKLKSNAIGIDIYLDGHHVDGHIYSDQDIYPGLCDTIDGSTKYIRGRFEYRPFVFVEIQRDEVSSFDLTQSVHVDLGTVTVKAYHVKRHGTLALSSQEWHDEHISGRLTAMPEQKLKGMNITHSTGLGTKQSGHHRDLIDTEYVDGINSPFAIFRFKCCSKNALQAMLLIPRTPPLEECPIETLSVQEMHQLLRRYQSRSAEPEARTKLESTIAEQRIKQERDTNQERPVKRERDEETDEILASASVKKVKRGETIDLSVE